MEACPAAVPRPGCDPLLVSTDSIEDVKQDQRTSLCQLILPLSPGRDDEDDDDEEECPGSAGAGMGATDQVPLTAEGADAVLKQIEFYFSDASLPSDKKLLKQIRKDPDGFVPIKVFANFRKVRALTRDVNAISAALQASKVLLLKDDGKQVRRIIPVPEYNIEEIQRRTVVVENLPIGSTIESVTKMMRQYGTVKLVRICSKETKGKLPTWLTTALGSAALHTTNSTGGGRSTPTARGGNSTPTAAESNKPPHAYVEYADEEEAVMAVAALHDTEGWRPLGIQVHHLIFASSSTPRAGRQERPLARSSTLGVPGNPTSAMQRRNSHREESPSYAGSHHHLAPSMSERPPAGAGGWRSSGPGSTGGISHLGRRGSAAYEPGSAPCSNPSTPNRGAVASRFVASAGGMGANDASELTSVPSKRYVPPGRRSIEPGGFSGAASPSMPASPMHPGVAPSYSMQQRMAVNCGSPHSPSGAAPPVPPMSPYEAINGPQASNDAVINPSQLALRPIRTVSMAKLNGGDSSTAVSPVDSSVCVAALLSPVAADQRNAMQRSPTACGEANTNGRNSPGHSRLGVPALQSGRTTPTNASSAGGVLPTRPSQGAPKFVLDLVPGSRGTSTGAGGAPPRAPGRHSSSTGASPMSMPAGTAARVFNAAVADASSHATANNAASNLVSFQPMSPSGMPNFANMPFHHSGQYITEVEDFINKIIPSGMSSGTPAVPGMPTAGTDGVATHQLSRVSEGTEREISISSGISHHGARSAARGGEAYGSNGGGSVGGGEADEEVARFRAALEEARGVNPASAQAQAHASRALAAAAAGGRPTARPPRPVGNNTSISSHASVAADSSTGAAPGAANGRNALMRQNSWHSTSSDGTGHVPSAMTDPGMQVVEQHVRHALGLPADLPHAQLSAAGEISLPALPTRLSGLPLRPSHAAPPAAPQSVGDAGGDDEGSDDGGGELEGGEGGAPQRRRRRRGSRAGSRSRRASTVSAAGVSEPNTPQAQSVGGELQLASAGGSQQEAAAAAATAHLRSQAARLVASAGGARAGSPQAQRVQLKPRDSGGSVGAQPQARRHSKADYASWAAATPEYRAEAVAKHNGATSETVATGLLSAAANGGSPARAAMPVGAGVEGSPAYGTPPQQQQQHAHHVTVAAGPDGTRGFHPSGRGRGAPLPQAAP